MGMKSVLIGLAGGTGSGKTSFAQQIAERVGAEHVLLLSQDAYYHDPSSLPFEERAAINYDHPDAFDLELLLEHLDELKELRPIPALAYDYVEHVRLLNDEPVDPKPIVILEGILVLESELLRRRLDIKLFIDTDADVRLLRRLERDIESRGRSLASVSKQYLETVRPMHLQFIEPSKRHADLIVTGGGQNEVALSLVVARIRTFLNSAASDTADERSD